MSFLLGYCRLVDGFNERLGFAVRWLVLAAVLISAGNATVRYTLDTSSNAFLEVQWYLFACVFLLCAPYTLLRNEHIRIDIFIAKWPKRRVAWLDLLGGVFFLLPMTVMLMWLGWPVFLDSYQHNEISSDAGGLLRWPIKFLIPLSFFLLSAQGLSEIFKRVAFLAGAIEDYAPKAPPAHGSAAP